jgi:hypothetical protein
MPDLVLGPMLRYVGDHDATVWVETDGPCEVAVLGARGRTFHVEGHHYALLLIEGLQPDTSTPYTVRLDDREVWPPADGRPPCRIVTRGGEDRVRLVFGSCRIGAPHREPWTLPPRAHPEGFGVDALWAYSKRLQRGDEAWPDCVLLMGDQVYADEVPPDTKEYIRERVERDRTARDRRAAPPPGEVANFEEYTRLHRESWSEPDIRWLLATVPSTMIFDDHDVHDDWNISAAWRERQQRLPWWRERICGAFMAYWIYQHIGNLSPDHMGDEPMLEEVRRDEDAGPRLRRFASAADEDSTSSRFAFHRDFGRTRLVVIDSRAARNLTPGAREIVDPDEWDWIVHQTAGGHDHLILASTLPVIMAPAIHHLQAWDERVCDGAWGRPAAWLGERIRQGLDFDHWPSFARSFRRMEDLLRLRGGDGYGPSPASILLLGGDVHTAYVAEVDVGPAVRSRVWQLVCSPFRKPLEPRERRLIRAMFTRPARAVAWALARAAGAPRPTVSWRVRSGPTFDNSIGVLEVEGRRARVAIRRTGEGGDPTELSGLHDLHLTDDRSPAGRRRRGRRPRP